MVIDTITLKPLHKLSEDGKKAYEDFLLKYSDNLILKKRYPFLYSSIKILEFLNINSSKLQEKYDQKLQEISKNRL
jgi:hypothetical protein